MDHSHACQQKTSPTKHHVMLFNIKTRLEIFHSANTLLKTCFKYFHPFRTPSACSGNHFLKQHCFLGGCILTVAELLKPATKTHWQFHLQTTVIKKKTRTQKAAFSQQKKINFQKESRVVLINVFVCTYLVSTRAPNIT